MDSFLSSNSSLTGETLGQMVASALAGSWRNDPPPLEISPDKLTALSPLLIKSGLAGLIWRRIRQLNLKPTATLRQLQQTYRLHSLRETLFEIELKKALEILRSAGIEPLLVKGWAIARLYPEAALRPYGDLDLCVRPEDYLAAKETLNSYEGRQCEIDLHRGFDNLDNERVDNLYSRSQLIRLGEIDVRVLSLEDHLRVMCAHLLRHGAWRPLWLCDIAVAVESRPADFDWDVCFARSRLHKNWVSSAIGLAHESLGAQVSDLPFAATVKRLPRWLTPHVLRKWEAPFPELFPPLSYSRPIATYFRRPSGLLKAIRARWPDRIEAAVSLRGPLNNYPGLHYQVGNLVLRSAKLLAAIPKKLRQQARYSELQ